MHIITGIERHYEWGSPTVIPFFLGQEPSGEPIAEVWFGAHFSAPSKVEPLDGEVPAGNLRSLVAADPVAALGADVAKRFGAKLPFLVKLIAPTRALSLQVHPDRKRAAFQFAREEQAGIPLDSPQRSYRDSNHKPELVFALTTFQAMCGFRAPRRAAELLRDLDTALSNSLYETLHELPNSEGVRAAFSSLLRDETRPSPEEVAAVAAACARRLEQGSMSPRVDQTVVRLHEQYPGDPGVVAPMLLNPVTLKPGEALFVPAGSVHAYLSGLAVEVMASSDNVLRAGLTAKPIDVEEMLESVDFVVGPPLRIAPERIGQVTDVFYAPVDDFELGVTTLTPELGEIELPGRSARIVLGISGQVRVSSGTESIELSPGQAVLIMADDAQPRVSGDGAIVQADVP